MCGRKYRFTWKGKWNYALAFFIVLAAFVFFFAFMKVMPFGPNDILISDVSAQNFPFLIELYRKVHSGESLFFSWSFGLGTNFYVIWFTFLASPINWLLMLLPESMLDMGVCWMVAIKIALCSVTAVYYFMHSDVLKRFRYQRQFSLMLGLAYALSNAVLCYYFMFQWLDIYLLLPLLALALERLVNRGQWKAYLVLLTLALFVNYVLAFPVCVFLVFWFLCQTDWHSFKKRFFMFAGSSLLAAVLCTVFFLPVICMLRQREVLVPDFDFVTYFLDLLNAMLPLNTLDSVDMLNSTNVFNVYCGAVSLFGLLFYILFGRDAWKRRIKLTALYGFLLVSLCVPVLGALWQSAVPHGFYNRFAFIYVFVALILAAKGLKDSIKASVIKGIIWLAACIGLFVLIIALAPELGSADIYIATMFILAVLGMSMILVQKKSIKPAAYVYILMGVCILEVTVSGVTGLVRERVYNWKEYLGYASISDLLEQGSDLGGRMTISGGTHLNTPVLFNGRSPGFFASMWPDGIIELYSALGLSSDANGYMYSDATDFTDLLFNVSTIITENPACYAANLQASGEKWNLLESEYAAGYGFMTDMQDVSVELEHENVFENQNTLFSALGGQGALFADYPLEELQVSAEYVFYERSGENTISYVNQLVAVEELPGDYETALSYVGNTVYANGVLTLEITFSEDVENLYIYLADDKCASYEAALDEVPMSVLQYEKTGTSCMFHVDEAKKGQKLSILVSSASGVSYEHTLTVYAAVYDAAAFRTFYEQVSQSVMEVTSMTGTGMTAEVTAEEAGTLYTSVVDDGGFTVYVDGEKTEYELLCGCLICIPLSAGNHIIEFQYCPPGFRLGRIISLLALLLTAALWNRKRLCRLRRGVQASIRTQDMEDKKENKRDE